MSKQRRASASSVLTQSQHGDAVQSEQGFLVEPIENRSTATPFRNISALPPRPADAERMIRRWSRLSESERSIRRTIKAGGIEIDEN